MKKLKHTIFFLLMAVGVHGCTAVEPSVPDDGPAAPKPYVEGSAILFVSEELAAELESPATRAGTISDFPIEVTGMERVFPDAGEWEERHRREGLHRWYRVTYDESLSVTRASALLRTARGVDIVESEQKTVSDAFPFNDPYASNQWFLNNNGKNGFVKGIDADVLPVWESFTAGSPDVTVAVIDTGVDASHDDLAGVVIPDGSNGSRNFIYDWASEPYVTHPERHASHVAGIIGAINNNGKGVSSVAGGSDGTGGVKILSCQALATGKSGSTPNAIVWAADHGAVIANNSWSYVYDSEDAVPSTTPAVCRTAFDLSLIHI